MKSAKQQNKFIAEPGYILNGKWVTNMQLAFSK
jgi:hypothetical protein